jgi:tetratricopeptide (TPR) repeat protein
VYLAITGRVTDAVTEAKLGYELDPLSTSQSNVLGLMYWFQRDLDKAIEQWNRSVEMSPTSAIPHQMLFAAYMTKSAYDKAAAELEQGLRLAGSTQQANAIAESYQRAGYQGMLRTTIQMQKNPSSSDYSPLSVARSYLLLGDEDQALAWLNKAYEAHSSSLFYLKVSPLWDSIRTDPRFQDLVHRMGLPQ